MQAVHLPSLPAGPFKGKTKAGPHGDFIFEMDYIVGELLKTLEDLGVAAIGSILTTGGQGVATQYGTVVSAVGGI
jgi:hypothetical protein